MSQVVPAILESSKQGFLDKLSVVTKLPGLERVHVDFGDGVFIETKLLPASDMDTLNPTLHYEAHLMVKQPKDFLDYQICGFKTIIIHYEAFDSRGDLLKTLEDIKGMGFRTSVALNPETKVGVLDGIMADEYLIMGVIPGKQGQGFIPETLQRISQLRKLKPNGIIEVDGGVNMSNIKGISEAGADLIVAGSAVVKQANPSEAFEKLKMEINKNKKF